METLLQSGWITEKTTQVLKALSGTDCESFLTLFSLAKFSVSLQREILEWVSDISHREGKPLSMILEETIHTILVEDRLNAPQKREKIREALFSRRFPRIAERLEIIRCLLNALNPPPGIRIVPVSPLEDNEFRLEIVFSSDEEFTHRLEKLKVFTESTSFTEFLDFLNK